MTPLGRTVRFSAAFFVLISGDLHDVVRAAVYRSPLAIAVAPEGKTLYVADPTAGCVVLLDAVAGKPLREIAVGEEPVAVALSADGKTLYVAQRKAGAVAVVDIAAAAITGRLPVGPWPVAVTLAEKSGRLFTCNRGDHTISVVDLRSGKLLGHIPVVRDPCCAVLTPDESRLVVTNYLPLGAGTDPSLAAEVSIVDPLAMRQTARPALPPGSTAARAACLSPDGRWAYIVHTVGRFGMPITLLERGWVHTYALSIIDVAAGVRLASVLLDGISSGAADPWDVACSADGKSLWISHSGVHEISLLDIGRIHELLAGRVPPALAQLKDGMRDNVWVRISKDKKVIAELSDDLTALYIAGAIRRAASGGMGPRGLALSPDGQKLYVANYYSGTVGVLDSASGKLLASIAVAQEPPPDAVRRGEIYFHDATRCFQHWHSCASCHLDGGRVDGLTWDFTRDGIGNGKDVISLVYMPHTSPHNRRATRSNPRECIQTGVTGSHFVVPSQREVDDLLCYVASLRPEPNPNAAQWAEAARRGKVIFEEKAGCAFCHPAPYYTDRTMHDVGTASPTEPDGLYDTPSLVEAYRTAPYLHDGRAVTIKDVLTKHDPDGLHGNLRALTPQEIDDLVAYVLSL